MTNDGRGNCQLMEKNGIVGPTWCILCGSASDPEHLAERHPGIFCAVHGHERPAVLCPVEITCHRCGAVIDTSLASFASVEEIIQRQRHRNIAGRRVVSETETK